MTVSTHVYAVTLQPGTQLGFKGGQIALDESAAPHVQGDVRVSVPSLSVLAALDPRMSPAPRVTVQATVTTPWGVQARTFDLTLRDRAVRHEAGEVVLSLSSDEGLAEDYKPLADDTSPFNLQTSLRAVVGYVLGKIGATLSASPSGDASVQTYSDSTNYIANPSARVDLTGWVPTGLSSFIRTSLGGFANSTGNAFRLDGSASTQATYAETVVNNPTALAGKRVRVHARQRNAAGAIGGALSADALRVSVFCSRNGGLSYPLLAQTPTGPTTSGATRDHDAIFDVPDDATHLLVRLHHGAQSTAVVYWGDVLIAPYSGDPTDLAYFDGSTTAAGYMFAWTGTAGLSPSSRVATIKRTPDALLWRAGVNALAFLAPLVQAAGFRLVCDEARVWTLRGEGYEAPGAIEVRHGVNLIDGTDQMSRSEGLWFDACVVVYTWTDARGIEREAVDSYALTATPTRVERLERSTPYPGPGFAAYAVRRAQGRGREVSATIVAGWTERAEQPIQIVLEGAPTQIGKTSRVVFDLDRDEVTITTRTTDTPPSAWALIPTGQRWIDSPAGASWTSEAI